MFRSKLLFDCLAKFLPFGHIEIIADECFELVSGVFHPFIVALGFFAAALFIVKPRFEPPSLSELLLLAKIKKAEAMTKAAKSAPARTDVVKQFLASAREPASAAPPPPDEERPWWRKLFGAPAKPALWR